MHIENIIQMSKDVILKQGYHIPAMHVEFKSGIPAYLLMPNIFSAKQDFQIIRNFYTAGARIGGDYPSESIATLALIAEAWLTKRSSAPASTPQRVEVLIVTAMEFSNEDDAKVSTYIIEMIRDRQGDLVDLFPWPKEDGEKVDTQPLISFAAGFESVKMTDAEKREIAAQEASRLGIDFSGEDIAKIVESLENRHLYKFNLSPDGKMPARGNILRKSKKKRRHARGW